MKRQRGYIDFPFRGAMRALIVIGVVAGILLGLALPWLLRLLGRLFTWIGALLS